MISDVLTIVLSVKVVSSLT